MSKLITKFSLKTPGGGGCVVNKAVRYSSSCPNEAQNSFFCVLIVSHKNPAGSFFSFKFYFGFSFQLDKGKGLFCALYEIYLPIYIYFFIVFAGISSRMRRKWAFRSWDLASLSSWDLFRKAPLIQSMENMNGCWR